MKTSAAIAAAAVTMDKGGEHAVALSACALSLWIGMWVVLPSATLWLPSVLFGLPRGLALTCGIWATLANAPPLPRRVAFIKFLQRMTDWFPRHAIANEAGLRRAPGAKPAVFAHHPHGVVAINCLAVGSRADCRAVVSDICFQMPFNRQLMQTVGGIGARRETVAAEMRRGVDLAVIPGGIDEVVLADPVHERVFLKRRFGFVKLALERGYDLVPVYHLGESQMYGMLPLQRWGPILRCRLWMTKRFSLPFGFGVGAWFCPVLPRRVPCVSAVGEPVVLPKIDNPTRADVAKYHALYVKALVATYNEHRHLLPAYAGKDLEVW